jgi:hypothetical protein
MWSRLSREGRLWAAAGVLTLAYFALAATGHLVLDRLLAWGALAGIVVVVLGLAGAGVAVWALRQRLNLRQTVVVALAAGLFLWIAASLRIVQERLHLVQYAVLAGVLNAALRERAAPAGSSPGRPRQELWPGLGAVLLTAAVGWADEGIQGLMPRRYYDLRDVGLNAIGGLILVGCLVTVRRLARPPRT